MRPTVASACPATPEARAAGPPTCLATVVAAAGRETALVSAGTGTAPLPTPSTTPDEPLVDPTARDIDLTDPSEVADRVGDAVGEIWGGFLAQVPLIVLAGIILVVGLVLARFAQRGVVRATDNSKLDPAVARLIQTLARVAIIALVLLFALSVAGFNIGSVLAALGIAGIALALAMQSILENFIAGILILARRPFRPGDQVRLGEFEGTVVDVNMRATTVTQFDGEKVLLPNAQVFNEPITNTTERGRRRTEVMVGVDYRNDHDRAREVLFQAVQTVDGVLSEPPPRVLLDELGDSSVDFRIMYWTLPQNAEVNGVKDKVLGAAKSAIEAEGMTIPWPIRTLVVDPDSAGLPSVAGGRSDDGD